MSNKDWNGNSHSFASMLGARNFAQNEREVNDFYATDPTSIDDLLMFEKFSNNIWECAVGQGHLASRLKENGYQVKCSDLVDRGYPDTEIIDFLNFSGKFNGDIITNPPYKYVSEFILKSLECVNNGNKVAMFLKIQTLEGIKRYEQIYSCCPPRYIYVYSKRKACAINGEFGQHSSSAVCYAWFVWVKGDYSTTELKWIY